MRTRSPATVAVLAVYLMSSIACCGKTAGGTDGVVDGGSEPPPSMGDPSVFSGIDVSIRVNGGDAIDLDAREPDGSFPAEPPIHVVVGASVEINGGTAEGREPGLLLFVDGAQLVESASAGVPQLFSFQYEREGVAHGQRMDLEFRAAASTFTLPLEPPVVELVSPAPEAIVPADAPVVLDWTGVDVPPDAASISPRGQSCTISYRPEGPATFIPERDQSGEEPPCRFEVSAGWRVDVLEPPSPFRSLRVERRARRIQRFTVR